MPCAEEATTREWKQIHLCIVWRGKYLNKLLRLKYRMSAILRYFFFLPPL